MNSICAKFEEIWPVPDGVVCNDESGQYEAESSSAVLRSIRHNARLDTFTRCQETTDIYVSLMEELVKEIEECYQVISEDRSGCFVAECVDRAKQIIGREK